VHGWRIKGIRLSQHEDAIFEMTKRVIPESIKHQVKQDFFCWPLPRTLKTSMRVSVAACTLTFFLLPANAVLGRWQPKGQFHDFGYDSSRKFRSACAPSRKAFLASRLSVLNGTPEATTPTWTSVGAPADPAASAPSAKPESNLAQARTQAKAAPCRGTTETAPQMRAALLPVNSALAHSVKPIELQQVQSETQMAPKSALDQATAPEEGPIVQPLPAQDQPAMQMAPKPGLNQATPEEWPTVQPAPEGPATQTATKPALNQATAPDEGPIVQPLPIHEQPQMAPKTRP